MKLSLAVITCISGLVASSDVYTTNVYTTNNISTTNNNTESRLAAQKATAQAFIDGFHAWDIDAILSYRTPDCLQEVRPKSITKPAKNNTEYAAYFAKIKPLFQNFTVTVFDEIHDAEAGMSVIHASSDAMTSVGPYSNEYSLFFHFTEDGKKIKKIDEFVDSKYTAEFFPKLPIPA